MMWNGKYLLTRWVVLLGLALFMYPVLAQGPAELNVYYNGAQLRPVRKQLARLDSLLYTVDRSRITGVTVVGHTDSIFGRASNVALADRRASRMKELLVERAVPERLISVVAFNAPVPVVEHIVPSGRSRNRRVFLRIEYGTAIAPPRE